MCGTTLVFLIEFQLHGDDLADLCARRLANIAMQVKIEAPVPNRHQIDTPGFFWPVVYSDANWKRLAPAFSQACRAPCADKHIRIDAVNLNYGTKSQSTHGSCSSLLADDFDQDTFAS